MIRLLIISILFSGALYAQQDTIVPAESFFQWDSGQVILPLQVDAKWSMDALEYHYVSQEGVMAKYDSTGQMLFSQSIKSLGGVKSLEPINTMKVVHFSEEQQTLCYFDNTLTPSEDCLELIDQGIINASLISISDQPNKLWVLDQVNSTLVLLSLDGTKQGQEIKNLSGILDVDSVQQLLERDGKLFLRDRNRVYVFDIYGSLIETLNLETGVWMEAYDQAVFISDDSHLSFRSLVTKDSFQVDLPVDGVIEFKFRNGHFFFRTKTGVHKFRLQISE